MFPVQVAILPEASRTGSLQTDLPTDLRVGHLSDRLLRTNSYGSAAAEHLDILWVLFSAEAIPFI